MVFPQIPNRYDTDEQRMKRLEAQDEDSPRRTWLLFLAGLLLLLLMIPASLIGWGDVGLILVPIGLVLTLVGGITLLVARLRG
jgi:MYXO-CTERM domain-containing protein